MARDLRRAIDQCFAKVVGKPYVRTAPDDWRKATPRSFNCSSFVQWLALNVLGWGEEEKRTHHPPNVRALLAAGFPKVKEKELRAGDVLIYEDLNDESDLHAMVYIGDEEVIGACEDGGGVVRRAAEYDERWKLRFARRITKLSAALGPRQPRPTPRASSAKAPASRPSSTRSPPPSTSRRRRTV